jgi:hypothetical protein
MTVQQLKDKLNGMDSKTRVVISREGDRHFDFFEISDVSLHAGEPSRDEGTRKAEFKFDRNGPATWLFINVEEA